MQVVFVWLQFLGLASIIGFAGHHLCYYADIIADRTGLGRNWIGLILLSTITSLPELMSGISAVRFADDPNLAVGDILGSCVFNLTLVFVLDLMHRETSVYTKATMGNILSAALGMLLLSFVGFGIVTGPIFPKFALGHVGGFAAVIPLFYVLAMKMLYAFESKQRAIVGGTVDSKGARISLKRAYALFSVAAIFVLGAGTFLPFAGEKIIIAMDWNAAFVGTIFMAAATSIPELVVAVSAIRLRAIELALSNVLGSSLFNVVILTVDDIFYEKGYLLQVVSPSHLATTFSAIMMTGVVLVALIQPPQKRLLNTVSILSLTLIAVFFLNAYIIFAAKL
ncbi:MAG: sodium:calcium antiporter [Bdellovibrio sp.]|nr:sodium:calcium antiporter [Bdellovibrio sp.]